MISKVRRSLTMELAVYMTADECSTANHMSGTAGAAEAEKCMAAAGAGAARGTAAATAWKLDAWAATAACASAREHGLAASVLETGVA